MFRPSAHPVQRSKRWWRWWRTFVAFGVLVGAAAVFGAAVPETAPLDALGAGSTIEVQVAGRGGVPADASAAAINFTAVESPKDGFLTVYPCGVARPNTSTLNYEGGVLATANLAIVKLGVGGKVCVFTKEPADIVADVSGWYPVNTDYTALTPQRFLDTRPNQQTAGSTIALQVAGRGGVPADASAAAINFTAVESPRDGFLTVYPCGVARPNTSTLNYEGGVVATANLAIVKLGVGGKVCVFTKEPADIVADVSGWYPVNADYTALTPQRFLDTRPNQQTAGSTIALQVAGRGGVPADASAAAINFTAVESPRDGFLTVYPCGVARPNTSTLNYEGGVVATANLAIVELGVGGKVCVYTKEPADIVADVSGWYPTNADYTALTPQRFLDTRSPTTPVPPVTSSSTTTTTSTVAPSTSVVSSSELLPVYTPVTGCPEGNVVPLGQSSKAFNFEPLGSIWCFGLGDPPAPTAVEGPNSWVDDFTVATPMVRFEDRQMGYRVFDEAGGSPGQGQHWINQNHWMVDAKEGFTGGASLSPDRSFKFENGKMVVEGDFSADMAEYGQVTWGEITITSAAAPTGKIPDSLYAYGQFGGEWSVGCRLHERTPVCAVEGPSSNSPPDSNCFTLPGNYRVTEISFHQQCGTVHMGGFPPNGDLGPWRQCAPDVMDMACRDRFRLEVTKSSLTLYVNGVKYFEDANWPAAHQLPDSFVNGPVYVYQSNWQNRAGPRAYRFHWDHFAVNPSTGPTPSDSYARGMGTPSGLRSRTDLDVGTSASNVISRFCAI